MKPIIAVSGKNGQVGWELERLSGSYPQFQFVFRDRTELDITNSEQVARFFQEYKPSFFINTAAYTAVDKAETDQECAYKANAEAVGFLANQCKLYDTILITFSTDYVFNGDGKEPYKEDQPTEPINYYGYSKELGEKLALNNWEKTIIVRTSWVYSSHGNNFVKTMFRLMNERSEINVVNDQIGSPTYAKDLAKAVLQIIASGKPEFGIFHFSNKGVISWFDFASEIRDMARLDCNIHPISTSGFPTPAKRPAFSVLDKEKIVSEFNIPLKDWKKSLQECLEDILR